MLKIIANCSSSLTLPFHQNTKNTFWFKLFILLHYIKCNDQLWGEKWTAQMSALLIKQKYTLTSHYWHSWTTHTLPLWDVSSSKDAEPQFDKSNWGAADSDNTHSLKYLHSKRYFQTHLKNSVIHRAEWTENPHIKHNSPVVLHLGSHSADQKYPQCYQPLTCVSMQIYLKLSSVNCLVTAHMADIASVYYKTNNFSTSQPGFHWPPV